MSLHYGTKWTMMPRVSGQSLAAQSDLDLSLTHFDHSRNGQTCVQCMKYHEGTAN